ncbi:MAG: family 43 glycosylhydrolase [Armatimonadetes bacterium]|nr:family 43 glycosylhydrolase [Armatimonadota bacterium]
MNESLNPALLVEPTRTVAPRATFHNPLKADGADPWLTWHDGWYYLSTTGGTRLQMRRARHLADLKNAPDRTVWEDTEPSRSKHIWAPEYHLLESGRGLRWYLYYTASDDVDANHRMYVAESAGADPLGPYVFKARLQTDPKNAFYAIDGSVLKTSNGEMYFLWCGRPSPAGQGIYLSKMKNPWTLTGERVYLPASGFGCKEVREGPVALQRGGKIFLAYSACDTGKPDYKLGMLIADADSDLMNPASWKQHPTPVFARVDQYGVFGPGHNTFFKSPDGKEDWIVYHAKTTSEYTYAGRSTRTQPITWRADGTPDFGLPLPLDAAIPVPSGEPSPDPDSRVPDSPETTVLTGY